MPSIIMSQINPPSDTSANMTSLPDPNIAAIIWHVSVAMVGLPGNIMILLVYGSSTKMTSSQICLYTIAIADLLGCLNLPIRYQFFQNHFVFLNPWCKIGESTTIFVTHLELSLLSLAAVERYRAVQNINNNRHTSRVNIFVMVSLCILIAITFSVLATSLLSLCEQANFNSSVRMIAFGVFVLPFLIIIAVMYLKIALILRRRVGAETPQISPENQLQPEIHFDSNRSAHPQHIQSQHNLPVHMPKVTSPNVRQQSNPGPSDYQQRGQDFKKISQQHSQSVLGLKNQIPHEEEQDGSSEAWNDPSRTITDKDFIEIQFVEVARKRQRVGETTSVDWLEDYKDNIKQLTDAEHAQAMASHWQQLPGVVIQNDSDTTAEKIIRPSIARNLAHDPPSSQEDVIPHIPQLDTAEEPNPRYSNLWLLRKITIMLFITTTVCVFTFCMVLLSRIFWPENKFIFNVFVDLTIINYAINPFIYSIVNKSFRDEWIICYRKVRQFVRQHW